MSDLEWDSDEGSEDAHRFESRSNKIQKLEGKDKLFLMNYNEAVALYKLLKHEFIPHDENYEVILRLINGLVNFIADCEAK
jgi:hypothetical protein